MHELQGVHESFQSREIGNAGRTAEKMPRQPRGGGRRGLGNADYSEMLREAITGKKTMAAAMLATNQRTYRAIVSFAAE
jgi:hypothetical protein